ncbi:MAG: hypothetical protein KJZ72_13910 [Anaerolineales bacterium]|nr:hypothetical protein [Anaerolineales bacterium]
MVKKKYQGYCRICGEFGDLSFEHVPPRSAFNNRPVRYINFGSELVLGPEEQVKGPIQRKGMGGYTLCVRCNNITGHWYGSQFVDWCYQAMNILIRAEGKPSLIYLTRLYPLPVIKQIVAMFFSINSLDFRKANPDLVDFVLNKDKLYLSPKYRIFVYYNIEGNFRTTGVTAAMNIVKGKKISLLTELSYPPFGYIMTFDSEPSDNRVFEITHFARYSYGTWTPMELKLPILPTYLGIPGDYRTKEEIVEETKRNIENADKRKN